MEHCINPLLWRCRETSCNSSLYLLCSRRTTVFSIFCVAANTVLHFLRCFGVRVDCPSSEVRCEEQKNPFPEMLLKLVSILSAQIPCTEVRLGLFSLWECWFKSPSSCWTMKLWDLAKGKNCISQKLCKCLTPVLGKASTILTTHFYGNVQTSCNRPRRLFNFENSKNSHKLSCISHTHLALWDAQSWHQRVNVDRSVWSHSTWTDYILNSDTVTVKL